jgi:hypothetical protein
MRIELTRDELGIINNALNEVCNDIEFETRMGGTLQEAREVLTKIHDLVRAINDGPRRTVIMTVVRKVFESSMNPDYIEDQLEHLSWQVNLLEQQLDGSGGPLWDLSWQIEGSRRIQMIGDYLRELRIKAAGAPITNSSEEDRRRTVVQRLNDAQMNLEELDLAPYYGMWAHWGWEAAAIWQPTRIGEALNAEDGYSLLLLDLQRMQSLVAEESWRSDMSLDEVESATDVILEKLHNILKKIESESRYAERKLRKRTEVEALEAKRIEELRQKRPPFRGGV